MTDAEKQEWGRLFGESIGKAQGESLRCEMQAIQVGFDRSLAAVKEFAAAVKQEG